MQKKKQFLPQTDLPKNLVAMHALLWWEIWFLTDFRYWPYESDGFFYVHTVRLWLFTYFLFTLCYIVRYRNLEKLIPKFLGFVFANALCLVKFQTETQPALSKVGQR